MTVSIVVGALLSHWRRAPWEAALFLAGLASATALLSGVLALNNHARVSYEAASEQIGGVALARLETDSGAPFAEAAFADLRRRGILVSPIVEGRVEVGGAGFAVVGVDLATAPRGGATASPFRADEGPEMSELLLPPYAVLASAETAARLRRADLAGFGPASPLVRVYENAAVAPGTLLMDIGAAQSLLALDGRLTALVFPTSGEKVGPRIEAAGVALRRVDPVGGVEAGRLSGSFHLNLTAFGLLSFFVGLLIAHSAIAMSFERRKGTFRTLRACGVTTRQAIGAFLLEVILLSLLAGAVGVVAGHAVASMTLPGVALTLEGLYGERVSRSLSFRPEWAAASIGVSVLGALLAAASSLAQLARLGAIDIARREAWAESFSGANGRVLIGAFAIGVGGSAASLAAGGLAGGFVAMACVLIASALLLPAILGASVAALARTARGPVTEWFWADARQQLPSLSLALQALLIALAANIGVATMVGGFRDTFVVWLDQRLASEAFLRNDPSGEVREWLLTHPDVDRVLPFGFVEGRSDGAPLNVVAFTDDATYRDNWPLLSATDDVWDAVAGGDGALINEQMHRRRDLGVGDHVSVATPAGEWSPRVVGVYSDYGNPRDELMAALRAVSERWPEFEADLFQIRLLDDEPETASALVAATRERFGLSMDAIIDQPALKRFSIRIFEQTFLVTDALGVLTLGVSGVALFTGLATLASARLTQVAPVWALGVSRRRLALFDFLKTLALSVMTALAAIPLGVVVAWLLTAVVNVEAFGWRLPLFHYPGTWLRLVAVATVISAIASIPTYIALRRAKSAAFLAAFASER